MAAVQRRSYPIDMIMIINGPLEIGVQHFLRKQIMNVPANYV
jgi:hypothetical protein